MKRQVLTAAIVFILLGFFGCANDPDGGIGEDVFSGEREGEREIEQIYTVKIEKSGAEKGDTVTASHFEGINGATVTINYTLADTAKHNFLEFEGVSSAIDAVNSAGQGKKTYTINDADAKSGIITINAVFTHNAIAFTENKSRITKTYGDPAFTNAVAEEYSRGGSITYSSSDISVADVDNTGRITIKKAGSTTITAVVQEDAGSTIITAFAQENAQAKYTLTVNPKPVSITGMTASNKTYNGTTTVTINTTRAVINGKIDGDNVTVDVSNAVFEDKNVGTAKTVTGISLTGDDAGNYILIQPNIKPNITAKNVTIIGLSAADKVYDGTATATVDKTNMVINGKIEGDDVTVVAGTAEFDNSTTGFTPLPNITPDGKAKYVVFDNWRLTGTDAKNYNLSYQPSSVKADIIGLSLKDSPLFAGQTKTIRTAVYPVQDVVNWKSSNTGVVTVSSDGIVTAVASSGSAVITAVTADGVYTAKCTVKVIPTIDMALIPSGSFIMGGNGGGKQHKVTLTKSFYMGKGMVTQQQWEALTGRKVWEQQEQGSAYSIVDFGRGDNHPINCVNWYDALVFCNRLSIIEGLNPVYSIKGSTNPDDWGDAPYKNSSLKIIGDTATWDAVVMDMRKNGYRLPTEAEWEYACRGDYPNKAEQYDTVPYGIGNGIVVTTDIANFGSSDNRIKEMGSYPPNNYVLYEMHGNLNELCWDWYDSNYYSISPENDPVGSTSGTNRVFRGGCYYTGSNNNYLSSGYRGNGENPSARSAQQSFRVVRTAD
jgi:formylglycine-generating enzyme required for sulfatase activity